MPLFVGGVTLPPGGGNTVGNAFAPLTAGGLGFISPGLGGQQQATAPPYSNLMKQYTNWWNACYSCSFDIADGHMSMLCPAHLYKAGHDVYFTCQNVQQYINVGCNCSTYLRHRTQFLTM
jgi:hypothetical protein